MYAALCSTDLLRWRRQGDPGSTRYFLSLEDNLFRIFGGDRIKTLMTTFGVADLPIESKMLTNSLSEAQRKVCTLSTGRLCSESHSFKHFTFPIGISRWQDALM